MNRFAARKLLELRLLLLPAVLLFVQHTCQAQVTSQIQRANPLPASIVAQGKLQPAAGILKLTPLPGDRIEKIHVSPGDRVAENTLLATLEGSKLKNLEINKIATSIAHLNEAIYPSDYIVGDVLLVDDIDEFDYLPYE
jgi:multidrug efflux pump subunit AcrA (membrane-fusion protein)